jgi:hypothetical protein
MSPKTKKIVVIGGIAGIVAVIAGIVIVRRKKSNDLEKVILASVDNSGDETVGKLIEWPLKYGSGYLSDSERECVRAVQMWINKKIEENNTQALATLSVDGHFGTSTESALYKIAGVKQVSYTLFNTMEDYLNSTQTIGGFLNDLFSVKPD